MTSDEILEALRFARDQSPDRFGALEKLYEDQRSIAVSFAWDAFFGRAHKEEDGTWFSMCISSVADAGDFLVSQGVLERVRGDGRMAWFREVEK